MALWDLAWSFPETHREKVINLQAQAIFREQELA